LNWGSPETPELVPADLIHAAYWRWQILNIENIAVGIGVGIAYGLIGYASQDKPFSSKRFLRTIAIQTLATLGLVVTGISGDVYTARSVLRL
jgi:hypothetical protein